MAWSRAGWTENEEEMEAVIPSIWIQNEKVYWPTKINVKKAFKERADPEENWLMFPLIKVKFKDAKLLCIWLIHKILTFNCVFILQMFFLMFFKMMTIINSVESYAPNSTKYNPIKI